MRIRSFLRATLVSALFGALCAPLAAKEFLFIHNTNSGEISKISIPDHEVVDRFEIGLYMDYLAASPDGRTLYVNRIDSLAPEQGLNIGESGELIALDPISGAILWRVALDGMPHHMSVSKDGRYVFVPYYDTWWLAVVDTESRSVVQKILLGHGSHGTKLSPDGRRLYVGSMMNDTISIVDTESFEQIGRIPFDDGVRPFALTQDESTLYVQLSRHHSFEIVDVAARSVTGRVEMPALPDGTEMPKFYPHNVNHGIALTPDESKLLANGSIADYVAVYSHPELELLKTIPTGRDPNSIAFDLQGRFAYVSNRGSNDLSVIDLESLQEVKRLELGDYPQRMVVIDIPDDAEAAPLPEVTAVSSRQAAPTAPQPAAAPARVSAVTGEAKARDDLEILVMEAPMVLELAVGDLDAIPEGYSWRTRETQVFEVEQARILEVRVAQQRQKKKRRLEIALDFFSRKKSQRFDVELQIKESGRTLETLTTVASAGRRVPEQLNNGAVTEKLLVTLEEDVYQSLFGAEGKPELRLQIDPRD